MIYCTKHVGGEKFSLSKNNSCVLQVSVLCKKIFAYFLVAQLFLSMFHISVFATSKLTWKINDSVLTISGQDYMDNYGGPSQYNKTAPWYDYRWQITKIVIEKGVKSIGFSAFKEFSNVSEVIIADSVVQIGSDAFYGCKKLENIDIPNSVTVLGGGVFTNCTSLTEIFIPNSISNIGTMSFIACTNLTSVIIENDSALKYIGDYAFKGCTNLKHINLPKSLQSIGTSAFESCSSLESISFQDNIETIGESCFFNCSKLNALDIPDTILNIGKNAFKNTVFFNDKNNWENGSLYISNCLIEHRGVEKIKAGTICIADSAFLYTELSEAYLPDSTKSLSYRAFKNCKSIKKIYIPESVIYIGSDAFYGCTNLQGVYITNLGKWCNINFVDSYSNPLCLAHNLYLNNTLLTELVIPKTISKVKSNLFSGGTCFQKVTFHNELKDIGNSAFKGCTGISDLKIPDGITVISSFAFQDCSGLKNIVIPNSVKTIHYNAFKGCTGLNSVIIPRGVIKILNGAFKGCSSLKNLTFSDSVLEIYNEAFSDCSNLNEIIIPGNVMKIYDKAFSNCSALTNVLVIDGVTTIYDEVFSNCKNLREITIPDSVNYLGENTFYGCNNLTIKTKRGSYADSYAQDKNIPVAYIETHIHDFTGREEIIKPATCTEKGEKRVYCLNSSCGEYTVVAIDMIDHIKGDWEITEQPSCNKTGTKVKKCTSCGKVMESESIAMTKHTLSDVVTPPTPTSQGYTTHTCTVCGYSYVDSYTDYEAPHVHDFSGKEELIEAATCTKDGSKKVYCTGDGCDEYTIVTLPKIAHTAGEWEIIEPATCSKCGTKAKKCIGCGKVMETADVEMLKHSYVDTVTPPTPTAQGYTTHKCSVCGYQYIDSYTDYVEENPVQITIDTKKVRAGKAVLINVSLQNNPGMWGMDLAVNYDKTKLTLGSVTNGMVFADAEWTKGNLSGEKYILSYEAGGLENITANGVIATLEFTVNEDAQADDFYEISVSFNNGDIINADFEEINPAVVSGGIKVIDVIYGDLNGDGVVNKKDSLLMKMYLADNSKDIDKEAADVFHDGVINKKDSLYLKQFLAGLDVELGA